MQGCERDGGRRNGLHLLRSFHGHGVNHRLNVGDLTEVCEQEKLVNMLEDHGEVDHDVMLEMMLTRMNC